MIEHGIIKTRLLIPNRDKEGEDEVVGNGYRLKLGKSAESIILMDFT